LAGASGALAGD